MYYTHELYYTGHANLGQQQDDGENLTEFKPSDDRRNHLIGAKTSRDEQESALLFGCEARNRATYRSFVPSFPIQDSVSSKTKLTLEHGVLLHFPEFEQIPCNIMNIHNLL